MPPKPRFDAPRTPGVYAITCDGEVVYCGGTSRLRDRIYNHFHRLEKGCHKSPALQRRYDERGGEAFGFRVLEHVSTKEDVPEREIYWTAQFEGLLNAIPLGGTMHPETLQRRSQSAKQQMSDPEQRAMVVARCLENSKKVSERYRTDPEFREMRRQVGRYAGEMIKKKLEDPEHMEEHKRKIRERWADPEYKARLSEKLKSAWVRRKARNL